MFVTIKLIQMSSNKCLFEIDKIGLTKLGKRLGYPECCIKEFVARCNSFKFTTKRIPYRVSKNTGFVPCSYCSWKILTKQCTLEDLIQNRKVKTPFPNY